MVGKEQYDRIIALLAKFGLKPRLMPTMKGGARGVGGTTEFLLTAEVPTAVAGRCGTLLVDVVQEPIPLHAKKKDSLAIPRIGCYAII